MTPVTVLLTAAALTLIVFGNTELNFAKAALDTKATLMQIFSILLISVSC